MGMTYILYNLFIWDKFVKQNGDAKDNCCYNIPIKLYRSAIIIAHTMEIVAHTKIPKLNVLRVYRDLIKLLTVKKVGNCVCYDMFMNEEYVRSGTAEQEAMQ